MRFALLLSTALAVALPAGALAQQTGSGTAPPATAATQESGWSQADRDFARSAMAGSQFERQAAQLALTKDPDDQQVARFARRMDEDHATIANRLLAVVPPGGDAIPAEMTAEQKQELQKLEGLSGDSFTAAYIRGQVTAHEKDVAAFERFTEGDGSAALKGFATDTLPTLREHLEFARDVAQRMPVAEAPDGAPQRKPDAQ